MRHFRALKYPKSRENGSEKEALDDVLQRAMWYLKITRCFSSNSCFLRQNMLLYTNIFAQKEKNLDKKTKKKGSALRKRWIITGIVFFAMCSCIMALYGGGTQKNRSTDERDVSSERAGTDKRA